MSWCFALLVAAVPSQEVVLLDFYADWCGPCRSMQPVLKRLAQEGYPIRKINIDRQPQLAARYAVRQIPCFVMLARGRVVDRHVGATTRGRLLQMFRKAQALLGRVPKNSPSDSTQASPAPSQVFPAQEGQLNLGSNSPPGGKSLESLLLAASVRIKVNDPSGYSFGSGTIIDARGEKALVLTCGHLFRDSRGRGQVLVDLFGPGAPQGIPAQLIGYNLRRDLALLVIRPGVPVVAAPVAPMGYRVRVGDPVVSIGCDHGRPPTLWRSRITSLDRFAGPPNVQAAGQPVIGRSGGGLFSREGYLVGVCNAAIPSENQGLYAALGAIHAELNARGLAFVYRRPQGTLQQMLTQQTNSPPAQASAPQTNPAQRALNLVHQRDSDRRVPRLSLAQLRQLLQRPGAVFVVPVDASGNGQVFRLDDRTRKFLAQCLPQHGNPRINWTIQRVGSSSESAPPGALPKVEDNPGAAHFSAPPSPSSAAHSSSATLLWRRPGKVHK